jgi:hypothetical protein
MREYEEAVDRVCNDDDQPMVKWSTVIVQKYNDNSPVPEETTKGILDEVDHRFGGSTVTREVDGRELDPANRCVKIEPAIKVEVACERERLNEAKDFVQGIGRQLLQREMYFEGPDGVHFLKIDNLSYQAPSGGSVQPTADQPSVNETADARQEEMSNAIRTYFMEAVLKLHRFVSNA